MNKFVPLTAKQREERDRRENKLYELGKKLETPPSMEEFERRKERGEVSEDGEEVLPSDLDS